MKLVATAPSSGVISCGAEIKTRVVIGWRSAPDEGFADDEGRIAWRSSSTATSKLNRLDLALPKVMKVAEGCKTMGLTAQR